MDTELVVTVGGLIQALEGSNVSEIRFYKGDVPENLDPGEGAKGNLLLTVEIPEGGKYDASVLSYTFLSERVKTIRLAWGGTLVGVVEG